MFANRDSDSDGLKKEPPRKSRTENTELFDSIRLLFIWSLCLIFSVFSVRFFPWLFFFVRSHSLNRRFANLGVTVFALFISYL